MTSHKFFIALVHFASQVEVWYQHVYKTSLKFLLMEFHHTLRPFAARGHVPGYCLATPYWRASFPVTQCKQKSHSRSFKTGNLRLAHCIVDL